MYRYGNGYEYACAHTHTDREGETMFTLGWEKLWFLALITTALWEMIYIRLSTTYKRETYRDTLKSTFICS